MSETIDQPKLTYAPGPDLRATVAGLMIIGAASALTGLILRGNPIHTVNDGSRWNTVYALVHHHSYQIDLWPADSVRTWPLQPEGPFFTIDMVRRDGHFYSSKPALYPTIVAGGYHLLHKLTGLKIWYPKDERKGQPVFTAGRILLIFFNVVPFIVFLVFFYRLLVQFDIDGPAFVFCMGAAAGGTFLTAYCTTLTNHVPAAFCAFFAVYCIIQIWLARREAWYLYAGTGFFAALTASLELPAALFGVVSFVLVGARSWRSTLRYYVPAAVVPIAAFFATNYLATGGWKPYYAGFGTELYEYSEDSYWHPNNRTGIDAVEEPKPIYLAHMLVGHHGILALTPVFLFSVIGLLVPFRRQLKSLRWVQYSLTFMTVVVIVYFCRQTTNYGGLAHGLRWTFWLIPFWLLVLGQVIEWVFDYAVTRWVAWLCLALSVMNVGYSAKYPWGYSSAHALLRFLKIVDY